jgi:hypothetical protein
MTEKKKVKIIKNDNKLRKKAGVGEVSVHRIERAETLIQNNRVDFKEIALPALERLRKAIAAVSSGHETLSEDILKKITDPVMELKANGQMFKYDLVGILASVMLGFVEQIHTLDSDAIEIISAHEKTLSAIVSKSMNGDGGPMGAQLYSELHGACTRYYRKNPDKFKKHA